jgi:HYR domain
VLVPSDLTVEAQSAAGAVVGYAVTAFDDGNRTIPVSCTPPSGATFPIGTTTVTCSATATEQSTTATFSVTVVDRTPPAVTVPAGRTVRTTSRTGAIVRWAASALDSVDGVVSVACSPRAGSRLRVGTTRVHCTAADRARNVGSRSFTVRVLLLRRTSRASALLAPAAGARVTAAPLLRWRAVRNARFYNVQVYRAGQKILSAWPERARFRMQRTWTHRGRTFRLTTGVYTWFVWPALGTEASPTFGRLLGQSSFRVS